MQNGDYKKSHYLGYFNSNLSDNFFAIFISISALRICEFLLLQHQKTLQTISLSFYSPNLFIFHL